MGLSISEIDLLNPPDDVYFSLINTMRDIFNNDYENVLMPSAIKNARVLFFQSGAEVSTNSNCQFEDGCLELDTTSDTQKDACDAITSWAEDTNKDDDKGAFSLNTDSDYYKEGTGSIKMALDGVSNKEYGILKTITSEDWSSTDYLKIWAHCTHTGVQKPALAFYIKSGSNYYTTEAVELVEGDQELVFDISGMTRSDITEYGVFVCMHDGAACDVYIDDIRFAGDTFQTSGYVETSNTSLPVDVKELFLLEKIAALPEDTSRTVKISLDNTNWHTITDSDFESWISVSGWSEQTTKDNLKIRVELATTDNSLTPEYDDILVAYRLDTGA